MLALLLILPLQVAASPAQGTSAVSQTSAAPAPRPGTSAQGAAAIGPDDVVARISTIGVSVKLTLPAYKSDDVVLAGLKKRFGDRGLLQGRIQGDAGTVKMLSAYGEIHTSAEWRERLLENQLVGAGQFDVDGVACSEHAHDLEPPFSDFGWHAFLTAADTCFDLSIFTLRKGDASPITRADFQHTVGTARYAVLRMGAWDAMPAAVIEHMNAGLSRVGGGAWLAQQCESKAADWACALAAEEVGQREKMDAAQRLALCDRVIADFAKVAPASQPERLALLTAISGRAIALRDAGKLDEAMAALDMARPRAEEHGPLAEAAIAYETATVHALRKDGPATAKALREAFAGNPEWRAFVHHEPEIIALAGDKEIKAVMTEKP